MFNSEQIKEIIVTLFNNQYIPREENIEELARIVAKFEKAYSDEANK